ncbi:MAG TPA: hypothetical protein ENK17_02215, partial [Anaerolineae bacterium]|nr:hypothetical protein [Anaerolineae bacterium]
FRVLNGLVNFARCPHCGMQGALDIPFLYHDPDKELALVYMPMSAGRSDAERQRAIGQFANAAMNSLPPEERKAYLLQPQVFITLDGLANKILEADGVTPEMIEAQKGRSQLLERMLDASDEALDGLIAENEAQIDEDFFRTLDLNLELAQSTGQLAVVQRLLAVRDRLLELTAAGRRIRARQKMIDRLRADPTRSNFLNLLIEAPDQETRELLVIVGRPLMDYIFFQSLTSRIEQAEDDEEREQLLALRGEILSIRERLDQEVAEVYEDRAALIRGLIVSSDPEKLARSRFAEMDEAFFEVLQMMLHQAQTDNDLELESRLREVWELVMRLLEESLPPELQLFGQLTRASDEQEVERLLREHRSLLTDGLLELLEAGEKDMRQDGRLQIADNLALALRKAREMVRG